MDNAGGCGRKRKRKEKKDCLVDALAGIRLVAQGVFQLREIDQMEREMCQYLEDTWRGNSMWTQRY